MHGFVRQLFDYDGSNLFPRTRPDAFVSCLNNSDAIGITTIGELVDTSYMDPSADWETDMGWEPEFIYRVNPEQNRVTGDASGTMKAAKISQIPGLKFDAVLTEDLYVTNTVGLATAGRLYYRGTPLEDIIRDMLTAGATPKEVLKYINSCVFSVTLNGEQISHNQQLSYDEGTSLLLDYGYTYTDCSFGPSADYSLATFRTLHDVEINAGHFDSDVVWADSSISSIKLKEGSNVLENISDPNPEGYYSDPTGVRHHAYTDDYIFTVQAGTTTYNIVVSYTVMKCHLYKSNGDESSQSLSAGTFTFTFKVTGLAAKDVTAHDPIIIRADSNATPAATIITGPTFTGSTDVTVISKYDVVNGTSTGIWADDSVNLTANLTRYLVDGYFTPNSDYDPAVFVQNNPSAYEQAGVYKLDAGNEVDDASWLIGGSLTAASRNYNQDTNELKVEGTLTMQGVASGSNTFDLNVHYADSTVTPIKSGGAPSSVTVPAGIITLTGAFNASVDKDVDKHNPSVNITNVYLDDNPQPGDTSVSGYITYQLRDGYFTPGAQYTNSIFDNNNPSAYEQGGLHKLDASCLPFIIYGKANDINFNSTTPIISNHVYSGTIYFNSVPLTYYNTFKVFVEYSNSNVAANKLSNRPSSKSITAGTVSASHVIEYETPETQYHYVMATTNTTKLENVNYAYVNEILAADGYTTHLDESSTNSPSGTYVKTFSPEEQVGAGRKVFVIAAPVYYNDAKIFVAGYDQNVPFTLIPVNGDNDGIPYSSNSTDNVKYRLFKYKITQSSDPFIINKLELSHI